MLVDHLEDRFESIEFVEVDNSIRFTFVGEDIFVGTEEGSYLVTPPAFDALLNFLRIPIKYIERCRDSQEGIGLAIQNVNFWIQQQVKFSLLLEDKIVTQIFDGNRLYVPGIKINDMICDLIEDVKVVDYSIEGDLFHAVYVSETPFVYGDIKLKQGLRALYSDCFNVTPRFDAVLYDEETGAMYCWPVQGRKFRAASTTISQVMDQVDDFICTAVDEMDSQLAPAIEAMHTGDHTLIDSEAFVHSLVSELRMNKKQEAELVALMPTPMMPLREILEALCSATAAQANFEFIDLLNARDIQVACSMYMVKGDFK
jgi:hypothetical protein